MITESDIAAGGLTFARVSSHMAWMSERRRKHRPNGRVGGSETNRQAIINELVERDGDVCQLCDGELGPMLRKSTTGNKHDRLLLSIDHIVPAVYFGAVDRPWHPIALAVPYLADDLRNLQLAHRYCNQRKSDRI